MPKFEKLTLPNEGEIITFNQRKPNVPNNPIVPFIRGDGTGVDIWPATQIVLDSAIKKKEVNKQVKANYVIFQKNTQLFMNASSNVSNVEIANKIASTAALFRKYFPDASVNFSPWDNSNNESMQDTIDFAFHFPGWSPLIECRAILLQLRIENDNNGRVPKLLGIIMRGMIVPSERWRVATIGDWEMTGTHLPQKEQKDNLFLVCKELYKLFSKTSAGNKN